MKALWKFLSQPQNLAPLIALGGGLGFLWKEVIAPSAAPKKPEAAVVSPHAETPALTQQATASGGAAVNAAGSATVTVNSGAGASK